MKVAMITPLGMSPAVATEMARYLESEKLTDVILLPTRDEFVMAGTRLVEAALKVHYPNLRVHMHFMPMKDVSSEEEAIQAAREISKAICIEKFKIGTDKIYLNIAGGRKEVTVIATILGALFGITGIYHVINKEFSDINLYQNQIKNDIMNFIEEDLETRVKNYTKEMEKFDRLLFPDGAALNFIRIPVVPYPPEEVSRLKRMLRAGGLPIGEENIPDYLLKIYSSADLIVYNKQTGWIHPTDLGLEIGKMLRCEYL